MNKIAAYVLGAVFVVAGVWGFFSTNVLGFLAADMLSSIVHVVVGVVLIVLAAKPNVSMAFKVVGIVYVVFAILGFWQSTSVLFGAFATNAASNWFYLVVGLVVAVLGFMVKGGQSVPSVNAGSPQM